LVFQRDRHRKRQPAALRWGTVLPIFLLLYSPDLNPIEVIKDRLYDEIPVRDNEELQNIIQAEVRYFYANPQGIKSICKVNYKTMTGFLERV